MCVGHIYPVVALNVVINSVPTKVSNTGVGEIKLIPGRAKDSDDFWYPSRAGKPPYNFSPGKQKPPVRKDV